MTLKSLIMFGIFIFTIFGCLSGDSVDNSEDVVEEEIVQDDPNSLNHSSKITIEISKNIQYSDVFDTFSNQNNQGSLVFVILEVSGGF